ncbi:MAG: hypothetical protein IAA97_07315 [Spirochaetes bacterium]|uniref:Shikimate kinase n=1 Tax=Candidatus Ornithospirochaeta stercoripullorum TaxID=2840899 RepID=A0A9D9E1I5_9SPIO|nr:hypothetical protein [Candidatus Ornithospirochaeta stercoripullorum]
MARLYFTGIKHSGKTTQARLVASMLSVNYADSDDLVLSLTKAESIREYFREYGKERFMEAETEALRLYLSENSDFILSLGGGAADNTALMDLIQKTGKIIYLKRNESEMLPVILKHGMPAFLDPEDVEGSFHKVYTIRDAIYTSKADLIVDLGHYGDKEESARMLLGKLKENGYV